MNLLSAANRDVPAWKSRLLSWKHAVVPDARTPVSRLVALSALALLGMARVATAQPAYVQGAAQVPTAGQTVAVTYTAAQTTGDLNVVAIGWNDSTSSVSSVTDTNHNTYLVAAGPTTNSGNGTQVIYYAQNIASAAAGANTVTVTFSNSVAYPDVRAVESNGIATS
jgi:hypothetical protein